jgi:SAM-dependent methyltransferase
MPKIFNTYQDSLAFFKNISYKNNEYYVKGFHVNKPDVKVETRKLHTFVPEDLITTQITMGKDHARAVVRKEAVERFHPNKIDNKDFWVNCRKLFPLLSVCCGESKSIKEVNMRNLQMSKDVGIPLILDYLIKNTQEKLNFLEIGYGYGNIFKEYNDKCNYCGIDYVKHKSLQKHDNLIEIDKSGIPRKLYRKDYYDIIYSVNVLQHCSQKDRFKYFKQGYNVLKVGGFFIFTLFLMTKDNQNDFCWGVVDETGRGYTHFFNQLTECDRDYELFGYLDSLGFQPIKNHIGSNYFMGVIQKIR